MNKRKTIIVLGCCLLLALLVGYNFQKNHQKYTLTVNVEGQGTVLPDNRQFSSGEKVTLEVTPEDNWTFDHWDGIDGDQIVEDQITMNGNKTITAVFTPIDNVSIELNLSEPAIGKTYYIIFDDDPDYDNGYLHKLEGTIDDSLTVTDTTYYSKGTYYLYAIIDVDGDGIQSEAKWGDHYAVYGGTYNAPPKSPNATISDKETTSFELDSEVLIPSGNVVINASFPKAVEGSGWVTFYSKINDYEMKPYEFSIELDNTDEIEFITDLDPGTYTTIVWIDPNNNGVPETEEYMGYYGSADLVNVPGDYNVEVPETGFIILDVPMVNLDFSGESEVKSIWNLPKAAPGAKYKLTFFDAKGVNNIIKTGTCPDSATFELSETIPAGCYGIELEVDVNNTKYIDKGDYLGWYSTNSDISPVYPVIFITGNTYNISTDLVICGE